MIRLYFFLLTLFFIQGIAAQTSAVSDTNLTSYSTKIPAVYATAAEAWQNCCPKNKITACKQFEQELRQQLAALHAASNHKSRLLSTLAGKFDVECRQYDFINVKIEKDPVLEAAAGNATTDYFAVLDTYLRTVSARTDSAYKQYQGMALAEQLLRIYQQEIPGWALTVKKQLYTLQHLLQAKGYLKILATAKSTHVYYMQLLELRGVMLDRLLSINQQVEAANQLAAILVNSCKKNPESCR